jgi:hypothetical protein
VENTTPREAQEQQKIVSDHPGQKPSELNAQAGEASEVNQAEAENQDFLDLFQEEEAREADQSVAGPNLKGITAKSLKNQKASNEPMVGTSATNSENNLPPGKKSGSEAKQLTKWIKSSIVDKNKAGNMVKMMKRNVAGFNTETNSKEIENLREEDDEDTAKLQNDSVEVQSPLNGSHDEKNFPDIRVQKAESIQKNGLVTEGLKLEVNSLNESASSGILTVPKSSGKFKMIVQKQQERKRLQRLQFVEVVKNARLNLQKQLETEENPEVKEMIQELKNLEENVAESEKAAITSSPLSSPQTLGEVSESANSKKSSVNFNLISILSKAKKSLKSGRAKEVPLLTPVLKELEALEVLESEPERSPQLLQPKKQSAFFPSKEASNAEVRPQEETRSILVEEEETCFDEQFDSSALRKEKKEINATDADDLISDDVDDFFRISIEYDDIFADMGSNLEYFKTNEQPSLEEEDLISLSQSLQIDDGQEYDPNRTASFQPKSSVPDVNVYSQLGRNSYSSKKPARVSNDIEVYATNIHERVLVRIECRINT